MIKQVIKSIRKREKVPIVCIKEDGKLLKGKNVLIIGGSGGIGLAIAKKYLDCGAKVIITGTNEEKLKRCTLSVNNDNLAWHTIDITKVNSFDKIINESEGIFGTINTLVCAQGIHVPRKGLSFLTSTEEEYDNIMDVNLKGTYFICQSFAKYVIRNKEKGHILIISSQSALEPSWSPYRLSKYGTSSMTKGLAQQLLSSNIIVNGIGPGPTATNMQNYSNGDLITTNQNPIGRYTMPEEIAEYAKLLVSDLGDTIVGDTLYMSGGRGITEIR